MYKRKTRACERSSIQRGWLTERFYIGLTEYDPSLIGHLNKRIDELADNHVITASMQDWAHQIRLLGNGIAHEPQEPTEQEVEALASFTETLLKYLFTLPTEVEIRKTNTAGS